MGSNDRMWRGLVSGVADTVHEAGGLITAKASAAHAIGDVVLNLEGTHRWPSNGRFFVGSSGHTFTNKTNTSLTGVKDDNGDAGLIVAVREGQPATLYGGDLTLGASAQPQSDLDRLKLSFFVQTGIGSDLDLIGRNFGLRRTWAMPDEMYRKLLHVMLYVDATTPYALTKVLDALYGVGNYSMWEEPGKAPCEVFLTVGALVSAGYKGKAYLARGLELRATTGANTVDTLVAPATVSGVYAATDVYRAGTNYIHEQQNVNTEVVDPTAYSRLVPTWDGTEVGKWVISGSETWAVLTFVDATRIRVGRASESTGVLSAGQPHTLTVSESYFETWMVGHRIHVMLSDVAANMGIFNITAVVSSTAVTLDNPVGFASDASVQWQLLPKFPNGAAIIQLPKHTVVAKTVTTPVAIPNPGNVLVDYAAIPSMEVMATTDDNAEAQYAFYLWDSGFRVRELLDLVTAAGVDVTLVEE